MERIIDFIFLLVGIVIILIIFFVFFLFIWIIVLFCKMCEVVFEVLCGKFDVKVFMVF